MSIVLSLEKQKGKLSVWHSPALIKLNINYIQYIGILCIIQILRISYVHCTINCKAKGKLIVWPSPALIKFNILVYYVLLGNTQ